MTGKWMIAAGALALTFAGAGAAHAAAYIKFDGVPGESKVEVSWKVEKGEKVAPDSGTASRGGVNVAVGDINGDGRADIAAPGTEPQAIGLLLPAVQKVREAAAARPKGMACKVGATLRNLTIRNEDTAQIVGVPEATVTACSAEQISLNFTKVEAINPSGRRYRATVRQ